jgi:hypothetical protein
MILPARFRMSGRLRGVLTNDLPLWWADRSHPYGNCHPERGANLIIPRPYLLSLRRQMAAGRPRVGQA